MEILLWLVPPLVVTLVAMCWVGWVGRESRGEVDRDEALRRLGEALAKDPVSPAPGPATNPPREPSTGVALRRPAESGPQVTETPTGERRAS